MERITVKRKTSKDVDLEYIKSRIDYNPDTGEFVWKERTRKEYPHDNFRTTWNKKHAGKVVGHVMKNGYRDISVDHMRFTAHRLAWFFVTGYFPKEDIDHVNRDRDDNRFCNLREATRSQNLRNASLRSDNKSGVKGVSFDKKSGRWSVRMWNNDRIYQYLGAYDTLDEAKDVAERKRREFHGDFACNG